MENEKKTEFIIKPWACYTCARKMHYGYSFADNPWRPICVSTRCVFFKFTTGYTKESLLPFTSMYNPREPYLKSTNNIKYHTVEVDYWNNYPMDTTIAAMRIQQQKSAIEVIELLRTFGCRAVLAGGAAVDWLFRFTDEIKDMDIFVSGGEIEHNLYTKLSSLCYNFRKVGSHEYNTHVYECNLKSNNKQTVQIIIVPGYETLETYIDKFDINLSKVAFDGLFYVHEEAAHGYWNQVIRHNHTSTKRIVKYQQKFGWRTEEKPHPAPQEIDGDEIPF